MLKADKTFGDVAEAMKEPMLAVDGWQVRPLVLIDPFGLIGVSDKMADLPEIGDYGNVLSIPSMGLDTVLEAGMVFAMEPNCAIGRRVVNLGGTAVVGEDRGIELNDISTRLMRA